MGADGHIVIMDYEFLCKLLGEKYYGYVYEIFGHKVAVEYYGDYPIGHEYLYCLLCGSAYCSDEEHQKKDEEIREQVTIAKWEVWT